MQDPTWALRHVNVTVEPGETLGPRGSTGSGKSVLARCCRGCTTSPRARSASTADIRELSLPALRQAVATKFEDPTLFSMSVAENLRLGRPHATDEEMAQAIEIAAAQFVYDLPFGPRHPHRRAGHEPVRRSAAAPRRWRGHPRRAQDPRARRPAVGARRAHRGSAWSGAPPGPARLSPASSSCIGRRRSLLADKVALLVERRHDHGHRHARRPAQWPRVRYLRRGGELDEAAERSWRVGGRRRTNGWRGVRGYHIRPMPPSTWPSYDLGGRVPMTSTSGRRSTSRGTIWRGRVEGRAARRPDRGPCRAAVRPVRCSFSLLRPIRVRSPPCSRRRGGKRCAGPVPALVQRGIDVGPPILSGGSASADGDRRRCSWWCWSAISRMSSCSSSAGWARTCCSNCGGGSTATSSGSASRSMSATRRAGWCAASDLRRRGHRRPAGDGLRQPDHRRLR